MEVKDGMAKYRDRGGIPKEVKNRLEMEKSSMREEQEGRRPLRGDLDMRDFPGQEHRCNMHTPLSPFGAPRTEALLD